MAEGNFDRALSAVLQHEGGYVDQPSDPGGATNMGITRATLAAWRGISPVTRLPKAEVRNLDRGEAASIYRARYWNAVRGDALPAGLDYAVFDYAVNSGPSRAIKHLQEVLGVAVDGVIGPVTLAAVGRHDPRDLIDRLCRRRMRFLEGLSTFSTFGRGWTRRVEGVRSLALDMAGATEPLPPDYAPPEPPEGPPGRTWPAILAIFIALAVAGAFFIL